MEKLQKMSQDIQEAIEKAVEADAFKSVIEVTQKATVEETGSFEVIITTEDVDRMGEVISADGWKFDNYMKNPIVLWGHDYHTLPVGVTDSLEKTADGKILARGRFAPASANPFAQQVRELYDLGIIRATSVGFIPTKQEGNTIVEAELLEYSFVSVPANPMALSTLIKSNISINELVTKGLMNIKEEAPEEVSPEEKPAEPEVIVEVPADVPVDTGEVVEVPVEEVAVDAVVEKPEEVVEEAPTEPVVEEEKSIKDFTTVSNTISLLKEATLALESVVSHSECKDASSDETVEPSDVQAFKDFTEKRRILQVASTVLADVLAEARKGMEAKKKSR